MKAFIVRSDMPQQQVLTQLVQRYELMGWRVRSPQVFEGRHREAPIRLMREEELGRWKLIWGLLEFTGEDAVELLDAL